MIVPRHLSIKSILIAAISVPCLWNVSTSAQTPSMRHVFDITAEIDAPISGGKTHEGERILIPITGGIVKGEINGKILPGGADRQVIYPSQHKAHLKAEYSIMTCDSVVISVTNEGINRYAENDYYFMTSPRFECDPESSYSWLNNRIFICRPVEFASGSITLRVWVAE